MLERILLLWLVGELNAVVGQNGMNLIRNCGNHMTQELGCDCACHLLMHLSKSQLGCTVNGNKQVEFAFFGSDLGDVDVKVADGVLLESSFL